MLGLGERGEIVEIHRATACPLHADLDATHGSLRRAGSTSQGALAETESYAKLSNECSKIFDI